MLTSINWRQHLSYLCVLRGPVSTVSRSHRTRRHITPSWCRLCQINGCVHHVVYSDVSGTWLRFQSNHEVRGRSSTLRKRGAAFSTAVLSSCSLILPFAHFLSHSSLLSCPSSPLCVPLNPARGSRERCKLFCRGLGQCFDRKSNLTHLAPTKGICWQAFGFFCVLSLYTFWHSVSACGSWLFCCRRSATCCCDMTCVELWGSWRKIVDLFRPARRICSSGLAAFVKAWSVFGALTTQPPAKNQEVNSKLFVTIIYLLTYSLIIHYYALLIYVTLCLVMSWSLSWSVGAINPCSYYSDIFQVPWCHFCWSACCYYALLLYLYPRLLLIVH